MFKGKIESSIILIDGEEELKEAVFTAMI